MAWRLAKSLEVLRTQVNSAFPGRSTASDGTIGDTAHASGPSDHNPNAAGVVTAMDLTNDPAHGFDAHALADRLRVNRHPDLKYLISNRRIAGDFTGWNWKSYSGSNPHDKHIHISVGVGDDGQSRQPYDDLTKWAIIGGDMAELVEAQDIPDAARGYLMREPIDSPNKGDYIHVGKTWRQMQSDFMHSPARAAVQKKWDSIPVLEKKVADLTAENEQLKKGFVEIKTYAKKSDLGG